MRKAIALGAALTTFLVVPVSAATALAPSAVEREDRTYILLADRGLPKGLEQQVAALGGTTEHTYPEIGVAVISSAAVDFPSRAAGLPGVRSVIPDIEIHGGGGAPIGSTTDVNTAAVGNPPASGEDDVLFDLQWGMDAVDVPEAWATGARGAGVRVAVLDTGVDLDHPDLAPNLNLALSRSFVPGEGLEWSGDTPFSHGSHVAGTIAAADNGFGVIGVAPEAEIVLAKVIADDNSGTLSMVIGGFLHAVAVDADVINMSLGEPFRHSGYRDPATGQDISARVFAEMSALMIRLTRHALVNGSVLVAAAGNEAQNADADADTLFAPAGLPGVIAVAATAPEGWALDPTVDLDEPTEYTNYGRSLVDLAAPGGSLRQGTTQCTVAGLERPCAWFDGVFSVGGHGGWYWSEGTSFAAPHVSGVAALVIGQHGDLDPVKVTRILLGTADDLGQPGHDPWYGAGRVNAHRAVVAAGGSSG